MFYDITEEEQSCVVAAVRSYLEGVSRRATVAPQAALSR
jgi:hypothetical protein